MEIHYSAVDDSVFKVSFKQNAVVFAVNKQIRIIHIGQSIKPHST